MPVENRRVLRSGRFASAVVLLLAAGITAPRVATPGVAATAGGTEPIAMMVAKVSPAVVRIVAVRPPRPATDKADPQISNASGSDLKTNAIGSGFIIDPSGFIATNKHVVEDAIAVFVMFADGERFPAAVVGMPGKADMALLRIDARRPLPSVSFGDSDKMRVGDTVIAIGSPFGFDNSVTAGIISAANRDVMESPFDDYLQTDAAINHGNSGGPLFNTSGEVIGMNSLIFAPGTGSAGLGFAIPSNDLAFVFDHLMKTGKVKVGMLPIYTQQVTWTLMSALEVPDLEGALVSAVNDSQDTMRHGKIQAGDVIRSFNGQKVQDPRDLARKAARAPIGSDATLEICQNGALETVHVTIQEWGETSPAIGQGEARQTLGLQLASAHGQQDQPGVTVASVDPRGTAVDSGIQKGDTIIEVQQTSVSNPASAQHIFEVQSILRRRFTAVLVERDKKRLWIAIAMPN
jgi:serine protease Do